MKTVRRKSSLAPIILIVIAVAIIFGILCDLLFTAIERSIYPCPDEYEALVEKYSQEYGVPKEMIYAVIKTESDFDASAKSDKGAIGLMQMMPATFEWLAADILHDPYSVDMLYVPEINIKYGTYYLSRLYNRFGDWDTALAAYNCGEGNVSEWLTDPKYSEDGVKLNVSKIPNEFRETKNYVKKVNKALKHYSELYK